jgi:hypothetical protein
MRKIFVVILLLGSFCTAIAQPVKSFSSQPIEFAKQVQEFMDRAKVKEHSETSKAFLEVFNKNLSTDQQVEVMDLTNKMLVKKMTVFPYFLNYMNASIQLSKNTNFTRLFESWHRVLDTVMLKGNKDFSEFTKMSIELFRDNTLFFSNRHTWQLSSADYEFVITPEQKIRIEANNVTLIGKYNVDSTLILETGGYAIFPDNKWFGNHGKVDWRRMGYPEDSIFVNLNKYTVDLNAPGFDADSVFYQAAGKSTLGRFSEKVTSSSKPQQSNYPQFFAKETRTVFKDVYPGIDYLGQFSIQGSKYLALGTRENPAVLSLRRGERLVLKASANSFSFSEKSILSDQAAVSIYLSKDSIFHPGLSFNYTVETRKLLLFQDLKGMNRATFTDSYHQIDIDAEALTWNLDSTTISFRKTSGMSEAIADFKSVNFYSEGEYEAIGGVTSAHPLRLVKKFVKATGQTEFNANLFVSFSGFPEVAAKELLVTLSREGYITYDRANEMVYVKKKLDNFIDANDKKIDYDIIRIRSSVLRKDNGFLDLSTNELKVSGVKAVFLSDSHSVYIQPRGNQVSIGKNRSISFEGHVHAGPLDFYGDGFTFDYENFKIKMANVDSLKFRVYTDVTGINGRRQQYDLRTVFEKINGELLIDEPTNKAGLKKKPTYPIFKSNASCYVYFNRPELREGAYVREKFFFKVDPFIMDSLDLVNTKRGYDFGGTLVSGGIFPDIKETLVIQPDTSLGFVRKAPVEGYSAYSNKGRFFDTVFLNNTGLQGRGKLNYLSTTTRSSRFFFMPDSMVTTAEKFDIAKGRFGIGSFPKVEAEKVQERWYPKEDTLFVQSTTKAIQVFGNEAGVKGELIITPGGMSADGNISFGQETLTSNSFKFSDTKLSSSETRINIASIDTKVLAFASADINSAIDFESKKGVFKANGESADVIMGYNSYRTSLREFYWDLNAKEVLMGSKSAAQAETHFASTDSDQHGFEFDAKWAVFKLSDYTINAGGVEKVIAADAYIYPDSMKMMIGKSGKIMPLKNALIVLDTAEERHKITKAGVEIISKIKYKGDGFYAYKNLTDSVQKIFFNQVASNDSGVTEATAAIGEKKPFFLNPGFNFNGTISLYGGRKELQFKGVVTLPELPKDQKAEPFVINTLVDPTTPYIKTSRFIAQNNDTLISGFFLSPAAGIIYPSILGRRNSNDSVLFEANGVIVYDKIKKIYSIGDVSRLVEESSIGNVIKYDFTEKKIVADGKLDFGFNRSPGISTAIAGKLVYGLEKKSITVDATAVIDFGMPSDLNKVILEKMKGNDGEWDDQQNDGDQTLINLAQIVEPNKWEKLEEDVKLYSSIPDKGNFSKQMVFSQINLMYDLPNRSFKSKGDLGLANFAGKQMNKKTPGKFEVNYGLDGAMLNIALEPNDESYFLMTYRKNLLELYGSDLAYLALINEKIAKKKKGATEFIQGNSATYDDLLLRFK